MPQPAHTFSRIIVIFWGTLMKKKILSFTVSNNRFSLKLLVTIYSNNIINKATNYIQIIALSFLGYFIQERKFVKEFIPFCQNLCLKSAFCQKRVILFSQQAIQT